ncbi:hypothetical protein PM082_022535 [Marasmius tenuissimus]|nr:hypothetical protein PM082_022535 [Marasmius tenuissimus]
MVSIELWENIIEKCQDERLSLSTCSLVCRSWMPKARQLLFKDPLYLAYYKAPRFSALLNDPKCTLAPFITAVNLRVPRYFLDSSTPPKIGELAESLIDKCSSLTSLIIFGPSEAILPSFTSLSSSLTHLELDEGLDGLDTQLSVQAGTILSLVGSFSVLEHLAMYNTARTSISDPIEPIRNARTTNSSPSLPRLRCLRLKVIWNVFLPWFILPVLDFPGLETMELTLNSSPFPVVLPLLQSFMDLYSSSVKDLILYFRWTTIPAIDLGRFTALRSVSFRISGDTRGGDGLEEAKLANIVSMCPNRSRTNPLRVILSVINEDVEPVAIEGIHWIVKQKCMPEPI